MATKKSYLDLINECDNFPYPSTLSHTNLLSIYWRFIHTAPEKATQTLGYIPPPVNLALQSLPLHLSTHLHIHHPNRTITLTASSLSSRTNSLAAITSYLHSQGTFKILSSWRGEVYPIFTNNPPGTLYASIERAAAPLFGVVAYCVYLIATTHIPTNNKKELKLWIPRRSRNKSTWPGMLDTTVAGALVVGENPFECMLREAEEEASLPVSMVREKARDCGQVRYFGLSDGKKETGGGEEGLCQPECGVVYEIELEEETVPKPRDGEVEEFYCWSVGEVREALKRGEFKTNSAGVMVDWLRRHGLLGEGSEGDVEGEIERRMRRELEFPLM